MFLQVDAKLVFVHWYLDVCDQEVRIAYSVIRGALCTAHGTARLQLAHPMAAGRGVLRGACLV